MRCSPPRLSPLLALVAALAFEAPVPDPAMGLSHRTLIAPTGAAASDGFGTSVASAGDVNGDGWDDVIAGAPFNDGTYSNGGRAYVYYGGPAADDVADLTLIGATVGEQFGSSVASAGDVNGDGWGDVIVGAPWNDANGVDAGRAYVYFGGGSPDATADLQLTGGAAGDRFASSVASAGDVNGDGYGDLIVGAPYYDSATHTSAGRSYVYCGGAAPNAVADLTLDGPDAGEDRFGFSVASAGDVNGDGFDDLLVGAPYASGWATNDGAAVLYFGGPTADVTADFYLMGLSGGDLFGYSVAPAGDMDGDGYDDAIVGAPYHDRSEPLPDSGEAYIYFGGIMGFERDLTLPRVGSDDLFGFSVAAAGDVNGDGYDDAVVGMPDATVGYNGTEAGQALVYFGAATVDDTADLILSGDAAFDNFGSSVAPAGDVNGDGHADLIVGARGNDVSGAGAGRAYLYAAYPYLVLSPNGGEQWVAGHPATVRWFGHDAATLAISWDGGAAWTTLLSSVGGEEENEVALTAPSTPTEFAKVRLTYSGQTATRVNSDVSDGVFRIVLPEVAPAAVGRLRQTLTAGALGDYFGSDVAPAGDVNGDAFADVIVGAYSSDAGGTDIGRAHVYFGGAGVDGAADLTLTGAAAGDRFGYSVNTAGDVNGDGYDDVIVGAYLNDAAGADAGRAYVYFGGPSADAVADLTLTGEAAGDNFGGVVAGAGDVNGDGYDDVIVGGQGNDAGGSGAGRAYVFYGGWAPNNGADLTLTGAATGDNFGGAAASAGDVNGDGFDDVIVGARLNDAGGGSAGRAYVYLGGPGVDTSADVVLTGEAASDYFGGAVAGAGDVNGDGFDDVIIGAEGNDAGGSSAGRAYVYFGAPSMDAAADLVLTGAEASEGFGRAVAGAGDVNGDGLDDVVVGADLADVPGTSAGRACVYFGGPVPDAAADFAVTGGVAQDQLGAGVAGVGDVNGDGFDDVIAGMPHGDAGGSTAGRALVYSFARYDVVSPNGGETWDVGALKTIAWRGAEPADILLSVDGGASFNLLASDLGGRASNVYSLRVPHQPTRFARILITPTDPDVSGSDASDSLFTIEASITLLSLKAEPLDGGGVMLSWETDPGPDDLAGYRVERSEGGGEAWSILASLVKGTSYHDGTGGAGMRYRLTAVNGLGGELLLGETASTPPVALAAWPLPYRGGELTVSFAIHGRLGAPSGHARVTLHDLQGRIVRTLARGDYAAGSPTVSWDGCDEEGRRVADGVYFLRAVSGGETAELKVVIVR